MRISEFNPSDHMDFNPVPDLLFHYTSAANFAAILHSSTFRFSELTRTNDPRETRMLGVPFEDTSNNLTGLTSQDFVTSVRSGIKVACMTVDREMVHPQFGEGQGYLHRGFARPRNWAQYGDAHRGVCLVFVRDEVVASAEAVTGKPTVVVKHGPVTYRDIQLDGRSDGTLLRVPKDAYLADPKALAAKVRNDWTDELVFTKFVDWASECEYRIAVLGLEPRDTFAIPLRPTLAAIILGADYPPVELGVLEERLRIAGIPHVWVAQMYWDDALPGWSDLPRPIALRTTP